MSNWKILATAAAAALIGVVFAVQADAGWFRHRGHGHGHDPTEMREHAYRMVDRTLSQVDATDAQHETARGVVDATLAKLDELDLDRRGMRGEVMALLTAPDVDRDAIEAFRAEKIASADQASKILTEGLVELALILTPEQRAELDGLHDGHGAWH